LKQTEIDHLEEMYNHYHGLCFVCQNKATERAHILGQGKTSRKMYGDSNVDNPLSWLPTCQRHNALVDISQNIIAGRSICKIIESIFIDSEKRRLIENIVRKNIKRKEGKNGR
jgi:hypothetical protein